MSLYWSQFLVLAAAHLAAVISPGPDFLITLRQSVHNGLKPALFTACGIGCGILVHVAYVVLGVAVLLKIYPLSFVVVQWLGALYLLWLAYQCLRSQGVMAVDLSAQNVAVQSAYKAFFLGFWTNVLNPKATLFFLALYTNVVNVATPVAVQALYGLWMVVVTALWFCAVSFVLVRPAIRQRFLASGVWVDRILGVVLLAIAVRLMLTSI
jgi:threonine/homoserine/homoserine lactone efflux protein